MGGVRIGTSGWTYRHWRGRFYPADVPQKRWLEYYSSRFDTVELNASFYRIPPPSTTKGWAERTPEGFLFSVKVSRLITHVRRLQDCRDVLDWFFHDTEPMDGKTAVYLFQLPPSLVPDEALLGGFLEQLPKGRRYVFEFRSREAYAEALLKVLEDHGIGFCIHDFPGRESPALATSETVYIRFHGYGSRYGGCYPDAVLEEWAGRIRDWMAGGKEAFAYFNNDMDGHAITNAETLRRLV